MTLRTTLTRLVFVFLLAFPLLAFGQRQATNWHFGNQISISFATGEPVFDPPSSMETTEGCVAHSDQAGNLLFYTNGGGRPPTVPGQNTGVIWNRAHEPMYDMQGAEGGSFNAVQSSIAFPVPGDPAAGRYYLFTMEETAFNAGGSFPDQPLGRGLSYFIIDMNLNAGLGGVELADQRVFTPAYEGLTAIKMTDPATNGGYWMINHTGDTSLVVTAVTATGIGTPLVYPLVADAEVNSSIKGSPDGNWLICNQQLFSFDPLTGIPNPDPVFDFGSISKLTLSFTPDSRFVYAVRNGPAGRQLLRFDVLAADIEASASLLASLPAMGSNYQMEMGPNGSLYYLEEELEAGLFGLSEIVCPSNDQPTLNRYRLPLEGPAFYTGLPNYPPDIFSSLATDGDTLIITNDSFLVCPQSPVTLNPTTNGSNYSWSTGSEEDQIVVTQAGEYATTITGACQPVVERFVVENIPAVTFSVENLTDTTLLCAGQDTVSFTFATNQPLNELVWLASDTNEVGVTGFLDTFSFAVLGGINTVSLSLSNDCETVATTFSFSSADFNAEVTTNADPELCPGDPVTFFVQGTNVEAVIWEDSSAGTTRTVEAVDSTIDYLATVIGLCGDTLSLPVELDFSGCPLICDAAIPDLITPNNDGTNDLFQLFTNCPIVDYQLIIYNRWGQEVYTSSDPTAGWDGSKGGEAQPMDVYIYRILYRFPDDMAVRTADGQFSLVR